MEIIAIASLIASVVIGGTTAIVSGVQHNRAAKAQAAQMSLQVEAEKTQAAIEEQERQKRLQRVLATQNAIFGGSNVDMSTGTPSVIAGDTLTEASRQSRQAGLFSDTRAGILDSQISDTLSAGKTAMGIGFLNAGASLVQGLGGMAKVGSVPKTPGTSVPRGVATSGGDVYTGGIA